PVPRSTWSEGFKPGGGAVSRSFPPPYLPYDAIVVQNAFGYVAWAALRILLSLRIAVVMLDYQGSVLGHMSPYARRDGDLRVRQIRASADPKKRLAIARSIVQRGYRRRGSYVNVGAASTVQDLMKLESERAARHCLRCTQRLASVWPDHVFARPGH